MNFLAQMMGAAKPDGNAMAPSPFRYTLPYMQQDFRGMEGPSGLNFGMLLDMMRQRNAGGMGQQMPFGGDMMRPMQFRGLGGMGGMGGPRSPYTPMYGGGGMPPAGFRDDMQPGSRAGYMGNGGASDMFSMPDNPYRPRR